MDEIWSYSLANSLDGMYFYPLGFDESKSTNLWNQWTEGSVFRDYITVNDNERFAYSKVRNNQIKDVHPPFYYYLLHTICSFFPNTFSKWYGNSINLVMCLLSLFLLFTITRRLFSEKTALLCTFFYGFSAAAFNSFLFIRMYAMLVFFFLLSAWLYIKAIDTDKIRTYSVAIAITVALGCLTQYHYAVYAFWLTVTFDIICLFKKKYKAFWYVSAAALIGVGLFYLHFPVFIQQLNNSPRGSEAMNQISLTSLADHSEFWCFSIMYFLGIDIESGVLIAPALSFGFISILAIWAILLVSDKVLNKYPDTQDKLFIFIKKISESTKSLCSNRYHILLFFVPAYLFILTIIRTINYGLMGVFAGRYFFSIFPYMAVLFTIILLAPFKIIKQNKVQNPHKIITFIMIFLCGLSLLTNLEFFFSDNGSLPEASREAFREIAKDSVAIVFNSHEEFLHSMSEILQLTQKSFNIKIGTTIKLPMDALKKDDHNLLIAPTKMNIEAAKDLLEKQYHIKMTKKLTGLSHTIFYNVYELELLP